MVLAIRSFFLIRAGRGLKTSLPRVKDSMKTRIKAIDTYKALLRKGAYKLNILAGMARTRRRQANGYYKKTQKAG